MKLSSAPPILKHGGAVGAPARGAGGDFPRVSNLNLRISVWYSSIWIALTPSHLLLSQQPKYANKLTLICLESAIPKRQFLEHFHPSLFLQELVNLSFLVTYITGIRSIRVTMLLLHSFVWVAVAVTVLKESLVPRGQTNPRKNIAILISFPFSLMFLRTILETKPEKKTLQSPFFNPFGD